MAAKTWETDYRYRAIRASIHALGESFRDDPYQYPGSYCLPAGEKPVNGMNPGRVILVALIMGFALLAGGAVLSTRAEKLPENQPRWPLMAVAAACSFSGIATFFLPTLFARSIVSTFLGERGRRLGEFSYGNPIIASELSDSSPASMKISVDGDDHVLTLFDEQNRRLLIEGTGARYQIRAADVIDLRPFTFTNYVGAAIDYRIDEQTVLSIAIARVSYLLEIKRQLPFLFFWSRSTSNRLLRHCERTLCQTDVPRAPANP